MQLNGHRAHRTYPFLRILQHVLLSTLDVHFEQIDRLNPVLVHEGVHGHAVNLLPRFLGSIRRLRHRVSPVASKLVLNLSCTTCPPECGLNSDDVRILLKVFVEATENCSLPAPRQRFVH